MTENTCAVLTAVFPIVFLTVTLQRRDISMKVRRHPGVQKLSLWTMVAALFGLCFAIAGVQLHGLTTLAAVIAWLLTGAAIGGLATTLIALVATFEVEEEQSLHE